MEIRIAKPEDIETVFDMMVEFHEECGFHSRNLQKGYHHIEAMVRSGLCFLMIDPETGDLAGSVALETYTPWWSDELRVQDKWFYILPKYRSITSFKRLLKCAVDFASELKCTLYIQLNVEGADRKQVLFSKYMKQCMEVYEINYVGGSFAATK